MRNYVENRGVENEKLPCAESTLCGKAKRVLVYVCKFFFLGGGGGFNDGYKRDYRSFVRYYERHDRVANFELTKIG